LQATRLIIDTREQAPYSFAGFPVETERGTLATGDYALAGFEDRCAIERKALDDLVGCLMQGRDHFERELMRASSFDFFAVVVEGSVSDVLGQRYQSRAKPNSIIQSVAAFSVRYRVPFLWCGGRECGELMTFSLLSKYAYEIDKRFKRLTGKTNSNS
jgi:DNA excision repair protein ERCC-4